MQSPVQVQFHNMDPSEAAMAATRKLAAMLNRAYPKIMACRIRTEAPL